MSTPRWIVYVFPKLNILGQFNTVGLGRWTSGYQLIQNILPYVNFAQISKRSQRYTKISSIIIMLYVNFAKFRNALRGTLTY